MLRRIIGNSLKFRFIIVAAAASLIAVGVAQLRNAPIDVFPEFAPPRVEVQTPALGLSASEVESLVTIPLEHALNGIPDLDVIRSRSIEQLSQIELIFEQGTDLIEARQLVSERIATVVPTLPSWASPPFMIQPLSATSRTVKIGLTSDELSTMDMSMIAYWRIRSRLLRVPGVANVPIWGERLQMLQVQVDPERLAASKVTLEEVMNATADSLDAGLLSYSEGAFIGRGGWVETDGARLNVEHQLAIVTPSDLGEVAVRTNADGSTLRLRDVADLTWDHQPLIGDAVINDGEGLMLIVEKLPWANTLDVTEGVDAALAELEPALPGIEIDAEIFRPASFIEQSIENLSVAIFIGAILMILMLALFLYEWRTALISVVAIPLSLITAGLVLYWRGATINTMILAGFVIALGDIVDDAIIDIENVVRRLRIARAEKSTKSSARIILEASLEVRSAIVYATLIEVAAVAPIFMLEGLSGSFFRPLAASYALALLASMIVALTVTPAMSLMFFRKPGSLRHRESPVVPALKRGYGRVLQALMPKPRRAYAGVMAVSVFAVAVLPFMGQSLLPQFKERDFLMHWLAKPGTSQPEMVRITEQASVELRQIPGVRNFGAHIGQALLADEPVGIDFGENWISVDPDADYDETLDRVQEVVDGYPGLFRDVLTYLKERIREVLTGSSEAITVRIYGPDLAVLREQATSVNELLGDIEGVKENHVEFQEDIPQLQVEADLAAAQAVGLKPGDIRRSAAWLIAGQEAGDIFEGGKAYDVQLWSRPDVRASPSDVSALLIDTPRGTQVRLDEVARIDVVAVPNIIHHENLSRSIDVGANLDGTRDLGSVVGELEDRIELEVDWPLEYRAELLGEFQERQAASNRLFLFAIAAAAAVYLLLQASYRSWRLATLSFLTLPFALVGGVIAVYASSRIVSLGSLIGFFTVLGIVARNGIMLISHYQHLEHEEGMEFGRELVVRGAQERVVPILMTVLTTGLALIPLIITGDIPGQEIEYPMAIVILGGLISATLLNLFVVPSLYLAFAKQRPGGGLRSMRAVPQWTLALMVLSMALVACGSDGTVAPEQGVPTTQPFALEAGAPAGVIDAERPPPLEIRLSTGEVVSQFEVFDPGNFTAPTTIDNQWLPLTPGTRLVYEGLTIEEGEVLPHRLEFTVTDLVKVVDGVPSVVIWAVDYSDGELVETELAFYAQDDDGTVWRMGEYPEEWEDGEFVEAPTWLAGIEGARAGIAMEGTPTLGGATYSQGWGPTVEFTDRAWVLEVGASSCLRTDCYDGLVVVNEFNEEEPNAHQLKYYAEGVGNVEVGWRGDDTSIEELELVEVVRLDASQMAAVRDAALTLEERAYIISESVYGLTPRSDAPTLN